MYLKPRGPTRECVMKKKMKCVFYFEKKKNVFTNGTIFLFIKIVFQWIRVRFYNTIQQGS